MSENYKVIRRTREAIKDLKSQGLVHTKIAKLIGIAPAMIQDIIDIDEVALNVREPTIKKFEKFLKDREKAKKLREKMGGKEDHQYPGTGVIKTEQSKKPDTTISLLGELTEISARFAACGYRLDARLTMIHDPNERE